MEENEMAALSDGEYRADVFLAGGSGKASVTSPAKLTVSGDDVTAEIEWSSPNYDYMRVGEKEYYPVNDSGNSVFIIDVPALDEEFPVTAETTAMSEPHMIDYTLSFDSASAKTEGGGTVYICAALGAAAVIAAACAVMGRGRRGVNH